VRRLPQLTHKLLQMRTNNVTDLSTSKLAKTHQRGPERISAILQLSGTAEIDERAQQAVDRGHGQISPLCQFAQRGLAACIGNQTQKRKCPLHRLHTRLCWLRWGRNVVLLRVDHAAILTSHITTSSSW